MFLHEPYLNKFNIFEDLISRLGQNGLHYTFNILEIKVNNC